MDYRAVVPLVALLALAACSGDRATEPRAAGLASIVRPQPDSTLPPTPDPCAAQKQAVDLANMQYYWAAMFGDQASVNAAYQALERAIQALNACLSQAAGGTGGGGGGGGGGGVRPRPIPT